MSGSTTDVGTGRYEWVALDGTRHAATHWDMLPARMDRIIAFVPDMIPEPHTQADHDAMAEYPKRLREALARCRR